MQKLRRANEKGTVLELKAVFYMLASFIGFRPE